MSRVLEQRIRPVAAARAVARAPGAVEKLAGMDTGWSMSLDRLARALALRKENA